MIDTNLSAIYTWNIRIFYQCGSRKPVLGFAPDLCLFLFPSSPVQCVRDSNILSYQTEVLYDVGWESGDLISVRLDTKRRTVEWHKTVSANEENMEDIGKWIGISGQHSEYQYGDDDDHDLPIGFEMALELHRKGVNIGDMPVRLAIDVPKGGFVLLKDFSVELVDIS